MRRYQANTPLAGGKGATITRIDLDVRPELEGEDLNPIGVIAVIITSVGPNKEDKGTWQETFGTEAEYTAFMRGLEASVMFGGPRICTVLNQVPVKP